MKNPFVMGRVDGRPVEAVDTQSRISMVTNFTAAQCTAAFTVPGLQATVRKAVERRIRQLGKAGQL